MDATPIRLAVDIGAHTTVAVIATGRRRTPVLFGTTTTTGSTVTLPADGNGPGTQINDPKTTLAGPAADAATGVDAVAALLRHVAQAATAQAGPPTELLLTAPPGWGPRRHALLREAAARAGLPTPVIVAEPLAAAAHTAGLSPVPDGGCLLVCDIGHAATDVSVVQNTATGWQLLSTVTVPQATAHALDTALAATILTPAGATPDGRPPSDGLITAVQAAKAQLAATGRAAVAPPEPHPPVLLTGDHVDQAAAPMREAILDAAAHAVDAADIDPDQLHALTVIGGAAPLIAPHDTLAAKLGLSAAAVEHPQHALAYGALDVHTATGANPPKVLTRGRLRVRHLAAVVLPSAAACLMAVQDITDTQRLLPSRLIYTTDDYAKITAYFNMPQYATAAMFATYAAVAGGRFAAATLHRYDHDTDLPGHNAARAGRILVFTAATGLAIAALFGLLAESLFGGPTDIAPDFLRPVLLAALPAALVATAVGLIAPLIPRLRALPWADHLHHPVTAMLLAAAGIIGMQAAATGLPFRVPVSYQIVVIVGGRGGAALLGIAIALTLTRHRATAATLAAVLAAGFAIVHSHANAAILITAYLIAASAWWIRQAATIALLATPRDLIKQLAGQSGPAEPT